MNRFTEEQIKEIVKEYNDRIRYNFVDFSFSDYLESYHLNHDSSPLSDSEKYLIAIEFLNNN